MVASRSQVSDGLYMTEEQYLALDEASCPTEVDWRSTIADADKMNATHGHYHKPQPIEQREARDRAGTRRNYQISKRYWQPHNDVLPRKSRKGISRTSRKSTPVAPEHMRDL